MKQLFTILVIVAVIALAVFTGSWILDILAWIFNLFENLFGFIVSCLQWLSKIFNWFGWNKGIV